MPDNQPWLSFGWTKTQYFQFIRSALRKAFMRYPAGYKAVDPYVRYVDHFLKNGKTKKVREVQCQMCKEWFKISHVQIDHQIPCGSLRGYEDVEAFVENLFCGTENLVPLCKDMCHPIKTLADRNGISLDDARIEKEIIRIMKLPKTKILAMCHEAGYNDSQLSNEVKRRAAITEILRGK